MAKELVDVRDLLRPLKEEYDPRHRAFRRLRDFWHGRYWETSSDDSGSVSSIFRDLLKGAQKDIGPDVKLVHNLVQEVCVKYQTFLTPLPMIQMYIDPPESQKRRQQSTLKERYLYGVWAHSEMSKRLNRMAWYLPLMGHCYLGVFPDFEHNTPTALLRSPENAYPVQGWDGDEDAVIFRWEVTESRVARMFPGYRPVGDIRQQSKGKYGFPGFRRDEGVPSDPLVEVIEYSDDNEYTLWIGDQKVKGVEHEFGFNLFEPVKFIDVPDEPWGHGAVEQAVNLVEAGNALHSLVMQAFLQSVFPLLVLEDPMKFPEEIDTGPGGVIPVNAGGKAAYLQPPVQALQAHEQAILRNEQMVKQATSMPDVNFGQFKGSIVTGKAINELQGAGTGTTIEMVQSCGIGQALVAFNEKAITIGQRLFRDDTIRLHGHFIEGVADVQGRRFAMTLKGKDLIGSPRNEVVFAPTMNMHEKIVMGLQMAGAGLVSKEWQRNQVGIPDSKAMEDEIITETMQDAVLQGIVQALVNAGAPPEEGDFAAQQAVALIEGTPQPVPAATAQPMNSGLSPMPGGPSPAGGGGPPGAAPPGGPAPPPGGGGGPGPALGVMGGVSTPGGMPITNMPGGGQMLTPAMRMPPGSPIPGATTQGGGPEGAPTEGGGGIPLQEAVQALNSPNGEGKVQGRVFLVGEIVTRGSSDELDVALSEPADQETVAHFVPQYAGRISFTFVQNEPNEPFIEVTPGPEPQPGGPAPDENMLGGGPPPEE